MTRRRYYRLFALTFIAPALAVAILDCGDDDKASKPADLDASLADTSAPKSDGASTTDSATTTDSNTSDAPAADTGIDAGPSDAASDADAELDAGFDDAGCPLGTGPLPDLNDAGFPTSGLVLWLRGDRGVATVDGGSVCRWDDMSGHGNSFTPGAAQMPVLAPTGLRNRPAVSFVGDRNMRRNDVLGIAATSARTIAIFQAVPDTTHRIAFYQGNFATNDVYFGIDQNTFQGDGGHEGVYIHGNAYESNVLTNGQPRSHIYSITSMVPDGALPGLLTYAVDNTVTTLTRTAGGTGTSKVWDFSSASRTQIGVATASFTGAFIGEILVFERELTAGERTAVHSYFQTHFPP